MTPSSGAPDGPHDAAEETAAPLHVALVRPEIHWNTGNAGRSCLAAGARLHLVGPLGFSLEDREVRRAGVHHWKHVQPVLWERWEAFEAALPELGEPFFFTAREGRDLPEVRFPARAVLVFGPESAGFDDDFRARRRDRLVRIPLLAREGISLNLSTAVGIALYEVARQRNRGFAPGASPETPSPDGRRPAV